MEDEKITKKKGVQIVKKRFKELLKSFDFYPYHNSTIQFVRVRDKFIDRVFIDTYGYHLDVEYFIYPRCAPFVWLRGDSGRIYRTAKEEISTSLFWECEFAPNSCAAFYSVSHLEEVWKDVSHVFEKFVLPQMDAMTDEIFSSRLLNYSNNDKEFFLPYHTAGLDYDFFPGSDASATYAVEMWHFGKYEEGLPYLIYADKKYKEWVEEREYEDTHQYHSIVKIMELLDALLSLYESKKDGWTLEAQQLIDEVSQEWPRYIDLE